MRDMLITWNEEQKSFDINVVEVIDGITYPLLALSVDSMSADYNVLREMERVE